MLVLAVMVHMLKYAQMGHFTPWLYLCICQYLTARIWNFARFVLNPLLRHPRPQSQ